MHVYGGWTPLDAVCHLAAQNEMGAQIHGGYADLVVRSTGRKKAYDIHVP
jgi:hypothetical protein